MEVIISVFYSAGLQVNKPNFMVNAVKSAESGNPKPAVEDNNKRQIKRVKDKKLDGNGSVTPKKRPARGRFICWFPHRYATFRDNTEFFVDAGVKSCDESNKLLGSRATWTCWALWDSLQIMLCVCRLLTVCHEKLL